LPGENAPLSIFIRTFSINQNNLTFQFKVMSWKYRTALYSISYCKREVKMTRMAKTNAIGPIDKVEAGDPKKKFKHVSWFCVELGTWSTRLFRL
jgi:hypothetical protein